MGELSRFLTECSLVVEQTGLTWCWPEWGAPEHIPPYNRLYFILEGEGEVTVDGTVYSPQPGQLMLMPAGARQSFRCISRRCYHKYWCHFRAEWGALRLFDLVRPPLLVHLAQPEKMKRLFAALTEQTGQDSLAAPLREKAAMLEILALYLEETADEISYGSSAAVEAVRAVNSYIAAHLGEKITLEDLSSQLHFHPNYCVTFFNHYFGMPPLRYVSKMRLDRAKILLKTTALPIADVAAAAGYRDLFHFSRRFKEQTGYSPSDYRRL